VIDAHRIRELLPHRYPILLVDRVLELEPGETIVATKAVSLNEPWYARLGPAPDPAELDYPPVLLLESWAQAAGILANLSRPEAAGPGGDADVMLFGSASQVSFGDPVRPGDVLRHRVELARVMDGTVFVRGDSHVGGRPVLTVGQGVMAFRPADHMPTRPEPATTGRSQS
jgi:3-hydroxyacyl-[acyl-carrier-protein] dehydratase